MSTRRYKISGKEIPVWVQLYAYEMDMVHGHVSFDYKKQSYTRTIREDPKTKKLFFTWNKKIIYIDDFLAYTPKKICNLLKEPQKPGMLPPYQELCNSIMKYGVGVFKIKIYDDRYGWEDFRFVSDGPHKIDRAYKFDLKSLDGKRSCDYYCDDFGMLVQEGLIKVSI